MRLFLKVLCCVTVWLLIKFYVIYTFFFDIRGEIIRTVLCCIVY